MEILLLDGCPTMRRILRNLLGQVGMSDVEVPGSGSEAFARIQGGSLDGVISDWQPEPVTALELLKSYGPVPGAARCH
jgi:two-component system chemotaxis response regulator CheY